MLVRTRPFIKVYWDMISLDMWNIRNETIVIGECTQIRMSKIWQQIMYSKISCQ